jgi:hypothetical protein
MKKSILVGLVALGLVACAGEAPAPAEAPAAEVVEAAPAADAAVEAPAAEVVAAEEPAAQ